MKSPTHFKLSLIENTYSFLNQSLRHYKKTSRDAHEWPFALLHLTQSIELMLKWRLCEVHPLFIFEDIDHAKHTVSLETALGRLAAVGIVVGNKEKRCIQRASSIRNLVVHYEFELNKFECKTIYAQLFEFIHFFHVEHLRRELHTNILRENHALEARLMAYFRENFVIYHDIEMEKSHPKEIVAGQRVTHFTFGGKKYERIRYGDPLEGLDPSVADNQPCHDCYVIKGQYHLEGCDMERCPKCSGQAMCCACQTGRG